MPINATGSANSFTGYGSFISNEGGKDHDFRVESSGESNMLFVDGGTNRVGIGTGAPAGKLHVSGSVSDASILVASDAAAIELYPASGPALRFGTPGTTYSHQIYGTYSSKHQIQLVSSLDFQISGALGGVGYYFKQSTGFVGLGTSSPTAPLAVNGAAHVTGSILPGADNTHDLGSSDMRWANVYTGDLHLANERGDWTVVEEEDYLTIKNNKTGKRFKLLMEEIE